MSAIQAITAPDSTPSIEAYTVNFDSSANGSLDELMTSVFNEAAQKNKNADAALNIDLRDPNGALVAKHALDERNLWIQFITNATAKVRTAFESLVIKPQ
jgi:hypothetical protein